MIPQRPALREDVSVSGGFRKWGTGGKDTEWLHRAGFTRRNTRRAILAFLRDGLEDGERILHLTSGTYRLQMGFLAITDRHVVFGMSWAFLPFVKRRRTIPHELIAWVRADSKPWGARLALDSMAGGGILGNLEEADADRLRSLIYALSTREKERVAAHTGVSPLPTGRPKGQSWPSLTLPRRRPQPG
jgi:hypothetical protein